MFGLGVLGNLGLVGGGGVPSWVPIADGIPADLAFDFTQNLAWTKSTGALSTASSLLTCSRAISGTGHTYDYAGNSLGVYSGFLANVPRITDLGLLVEESRVNVVLNNRDLTQGTWTPSNITAAKDQVGIDGVANSASSIVATAGNGTILGATTVSSSARWQTAFVKRLVGTGTIQMTMDNGSTWTTITVTSSWSRVSIPTQTLANPTVGFKIVTSGDAVAIDFVQNEASATFGTSPIQTTSAAVTRNMDLDSITSIASIFTGTPASILTTHYPYSLGGSSSFQRVYDTTAAANFNLLASSPNWSAQQNANGTVLAGTLTANEIIKHGVVYSLNDERGYRNGSLISQDTSASDVTSISALYIGNRAAGDRSYSGFFRSFAVFTFAVSDSAMRALTA